MGERERVLDILKSGNFAELRGLPELDWLEFKGALYHLEDESQCHELAKDVSAIANAGGGLIIVGLDTTLDHKHSRELVSEIRPFQKERVNISKYEGTIAGRTFPSIRNISIQWFPCGQDPEKGLLAIKVDGAGEYRPVLVQKVFNEGRKTAGNLFAYFERNGTNAQHYTIQELHTLIQNGSRFASIDARLDLLTDAVNMLSQGDQFVVNEEGLRSTALQLSPKVLRQRIEGLLNSAGIEGKPSIAFAAVPTSLTNIPSLTLSTSEARSLLQHPQRLRPAGFDLGSYESASLVRGGQQRRAIIPNLKALELWSDGTFLFVATGDEDFLSHPTRPKDGPFLINPFVIAEVSYLFCETFRLALQLMNPIPATVNYVLEVRQLDAPGKPPAINPKKVPSSASYLPYYDGTMIPAPYGSETFNFTASTSQAAEETAFQYLRDFYLWFGIEEDRIPYTESESGRRRIAVNELK